MLTRSGCLDRQRRFRKRLTSQGIDAAAITDYHEIYYLTGLLLPVQFPALLLFETNGASWLACRLQDGDPWIDEVISYEWNKQGTMNPDPLRRLEELVAARLKGERRLTRIGWQTESMPRLLGECLARALHPEHWIALDDMLAEMQRRKDPDEVAVLRQAIRANLAGYMAAQTAIVPGANELGVLAAGQQGAMLAAGERVFHDGDYRCGVFNGPARDRRIERGEIYIIDAQTCYRGYWSDLSRAYIVGGEPTQVQQSIFDHIAEVQRLVPSLLRPGVDGQEVWRALDAHIRKHPLLAHSGLTHHGGHGIGLRLHEMPDINHHRGGMLDVGNVISVEPGGYTAAARYGVRIENTYLITEEGAENLSEYPVDIAP